MASGQAPQRAVRAGHRSMSMAPGSSSMLRGAVKKARATGVGLAALAVVADDDQRERERDR